MFVCRTLWCMMLKTKGQTFRENSLLLPPQSAMHKECVHYTSLALQNEFTVAFQPLAFGWSLPLCTQSPGAKQCEKENKFQVNRNWHRQVVKLNGLHLFFSLWFWPCMLLCNVACDRSNTDPQYPLGDVRNNSLCCWGSSKSLSRMDGLGFDNLRNLDLRQVVDFSYSTCQVSGGGLYLLPDNEW